MAPFSLNNPLEQIFKDLSVSVQGYNDPVRFNTTFEYKSTEGMDYVSVILRSEQRVAGQYLGARIDVMPTQTKNPLGAVYAIGTPKRKRNPVSPQYGVAALPAIQTVDSPNGITAMPISSGEVIRNAVLGGIDFAFSEIGMRANGGIDIQKGIGAKIRSMEDIQKSGDFFAPGQYSVSKQTQALRYSDIMWSPLGSTGNELTYDEEPIHLAALNNYLNSIGIGGYGFSRRNNRRLQRQAVYNQADQQYYAAVKAAEKQSLQDGSTIVTPYIQRGNRLVPATAELMTGQNRPLWGRSVISYPGAPNTGPIYGDVLTTLTMDIPAAGGAYWYDDTRTSARNKTFHGVGHPGNVKRIGKTGFNVQDFLENATVTLNERGFDPAFLEQNRNTSALYATISLGNKNVDLRQRWRSNAGVVTDFTLAVPEWYDPITGLGSSYEQKGFKRTDELIRGFQQRNPDVRVSNRENVDYIGQIVDTFTATGSKLRGGIKEGLRMAFGNYSIDGTPINMTSGEIKAPITASNIFAAFGQQQILDITSEYFSKKGATQEQIADWKSFFTQRYVGTNRMISPDILARKAQQMGLWTNGVGGGLGFEADIINDVIIKETDPEANLRHMKDYRNWTIMDNEQFYPQDLSVRESREYQYREMKEVGLSDEKINNMFRFVTPAGDRIPFTASLNTDKQAGRVYDVGRVEGRIKKGTLVATILQSSSYEPAAHGSAPLSLFEALNKTHPLFAQKMGLTIGQKFAPGAGDPATNAMVGLYSSWLQQRSFVSDTDRTEPESYINVDNNMAQKMRVLLAGDQPAIETLNSLKQIVGNDESMLYFKGGGYLPNPSTFEPLMTEDEFGEQINEGAVKRYTNAIRNSLAYASGGDTSETAKNRMLASIGAFWNPMTKMFSAGGNASKRPFSRSIAGAVGGKFSVLGLLRPGEWWAPRTTMRGMMNDLMRGDLGGVKQGMDFIKTNALAGVFARFPNLDVEHAWASMVRPPDEELYERAAEMGVTKQQFDASMKHPANRGTIFVPPDAPTRFIGDEDKDPFVLIPAYMNDKGNFVSITGTEANNRSTVEDTMRISKEMVPNATLRASLNAVQEQYKKIFDPNSHAYKKITEGFKLVGKAGATLQRSRREKDYQVGIGTGYNIQRNLMIGAAFVGADSQTLSELANMVPPQYNATLDAKQLAKGAEKGLRLASLMSSAFWTVNKNGEITLGTKIAELNERGEASWTKERLSPLSGWNTQDFLLETAKLLSQGESIEGRPNERLITKENFARMFAPVTEGNTEYERLLGRLSDDSKNWPEELNAYYSEAGQLPAGYFAQTPMGAGLLTSATMNAFGKLLGLKSSDSQEKIEKVTKNYEGSLVALEQLGGVDFKNAIVAAAGAGMFRNPKRKMKYTSARMMESVLRGAEGIDNFVGSTMRTLGKLFGVRTPPPTPPAQQAMEEAFAEMPPAQQELARKTYSRADVKFMPSASMLNSDPFGPDNGGRVFLTSAAVAQTITGKQKSDMFDTYESKLGQEIHTAIQKRLIESDKNGDKYNGLKLIATEQQFTTKVDGEDISATVDTLFEDEKGNLLIGEIKPTGENKIEKVTPQMALQLKAVREWAAVEHPGKKVEIGFMSYDRKINDTNKIVDAALAGGFSNVTKKVNKFIKSGGLSERVKSILSYMGMTKTQETIANIANRIDTGDYTHDSDQETTDFIKEFDQQMSASSGGASQPPRGNAPGSGGSGNRGGGGIPGEPPNNPPSDDGKYYAREGRNKNLPIHPARARENVQRFLTGYAANQTEFERIDASLRGTLGTMLGRQIFQNSDIATAFSEIAASDRLPALREAMGTDWDKITKAFPKLSKEYISALIAKQDLSSADQGDPAIGVRMNNIVNQGSVGGRLSQYAFMAGNSSFEDVAKEFKASEAVMKRFTDAMAEATKLREELNDTEAKGLKVSDALYKKLSNVEIEGKLAKIQEKREQMLFEGRASKQADGTYSFRTTDDAEDWLGLDIKQNDLNAKLTGREQKGRFGGGIGAFARNIFSGWGLMYMRTISGLAMSAVESGYGARIGQEEVTYNAFARAYGMPGYASPDQKLLAEQGAFLPSGGGILTRSAQSWVTRNAPSAITNTQLGFGALSVYGASQWAGGEWLQTLGLQYGSDEWKQKQGLVNKFSIGMAGASMIAPTAINAIGAMNDVRGSSVTLATRAIGGNPVANWAGGALTMGMNGAGLGFMAGGPIGGGIGAVVGAIASPLFDPMTWAKFNPEINQRSSAIQNIVNSGNYSLANGNYLLQSDVARTIAASQFSSLPQDQVAQALAYQMQRGYSNLSNTSQLAGLYSMGIDPKQFNERYFQSMGKGLGWYNQPGTSTGYQTKLSPNNIWAKINNITSGYSFLGNNLGTHFPVDINSFGQNNTLVPGKSPDQLLTEAKDAYIASQLSSGRTIDEIYASWNSGQGVADQLGISKYLPQTDKERLSTLDQISQLMQNPSGFSAWSSSVELWKTQRRAGASVGQLPLPQNYANLSSSEAARQEMSNARNTDMYQRYLAFDPTAWSLASQGNLQGITAFDLSKKQFQGMNGQTYSGSLLGFVDMTRGGTVTGRGGWGQSSFRSATNSPEVNAYNMFGKNWMNTPELRSGVYGYTAMNGQTYYGYDAVSLAQNRTSYEHQMASAGIQLRGLQLDWAFTTGVGLSKYNNTANPQGGTFGTLFQGGMWGLQDAQRNLGIQQQQWQFGMQQRQMDMSYRNFYENTGLQRQGDMMQRMWTQQDWSTNANIRAMQWGWKTEDFQENLRFMTGRDRRLAERQMSRETTMHNVEEEQIDKQKKRQEELWKLEDKRFEVQRRQFEESFKLQKEDFEKSKKFWEENKKLEDEQIKLVRAKYVLEHALQKESAGLSAAYAKKQYELNEQLITAKIEAEKAAAAVSMFNKQLEDVKNTAMNLPSNGGNGGHRQTVKLVVGDKEFDAYVIDVVGDKIYQDY